MADKQKREIEWKIKSMTDKSVSSIRVLSEAQVDISEKLSQQDEILSKILVTQGK